MEKRIISGGLWTRMATCWISLYRADETNKRRNDFFGNSTTENVMQKQTDPACIVNCTWTPSNVANFVGKAGSTYANNQQVDPGLNTTLPMPSGIDANGRPNTDHFQLTANTPMVVRTTNHPFYGDSIHGYSDDPNKFATDILGNSRTNWSMGAYEYTVGTPPSSQFHPADKDIDRKINLNEATSFGACWKSNCQSDATLNNAVRAGYL